MQSRIHRIHVGTWTLLTTTGLAGGLVGGLIVGMSLAQVANAMIVTAAVTCCVGAVLGGSQAVALRHLLAAPFWWVLSSIAGAGVGLATGVVIVEQIGILLSGSRPNVAALDPILRAASFLVIGLVTGGCLGLLQSLVLRKRSLPVRHWWGTCTIALGCAFAASSAIVDLLRFRFASPLGLALFVLSSGVIFGIGTIRPLHRAA